MRPDVRSRTAGWWLHLGGSKILSTIKVERMPLYRILARKERGPKLIPNAVLNATLAIDSRGAKPMAAAAAAAAYPLRPRVPAVPPTSTLLEFSPGLRPRASGEGKTGGSDCGGGGGSC
ncbi:hypothetical protein NL676_013747 [Syzygium grande]|nr:hypothetical protein NL676_013747 [Syzygium grande]